MIRSTASAIPPLDRLLSEKDVAAIAGVSVSWLQKLRLTGDGPTYHKLGKAVRYAEQDVRAWIAAQRR